MIWGHPSYIICQEFKSSFMAMVSSITMVNEPFDQSGHVNRLGVELEIHADSAVRLSWFTFRVQYPALRCTRPTSLHAPVTGEALERGGILEHLSTSLGRG